MGKIIKTIFYIALVILAIDFVGFMFWAMSGQYPIDGFYVGSITTHILQAVFF